MQQGRQVGNTGRASDCTGQTTTFVGDVRVLNTPNAEQLQGRAAEREGSERGGMVMK